jgi:hypothetical protein
MDDYSTISLRYSGFGVFGVFNSLTPTWKMEKGKYIGRGKETLQTLQTHQEGK